MLCRRLLLSFLLVAIVSLCAISFSRAQSSADSAEVAELLSKSQTRGGLIVQVGCEDIDRLIALQVGSRYLVRGLDRSWKRIEGVREELIQRERHGPVSAETWNGESLPFVAETVNLLVVSPHEEVGEQEIGRVLTPGGAVCVSTPEGWDISRKPWPDEIDDWSHWLHGPDNNAVSSDERIGISRSLQWYMPPRWTRHHNLPAGFNGLVSAGGRIYYLIDTAPHAILGPGKWSLVARDAFNGLELWRLPIEQWHMEAWGAEERYGGRIGRFHGAPDYQVPRRLVATEDRLYFTPGFHAPVVAFDGATGKVIHEYSQTKNTGEVLHEDECLFVARNTYGRKPGKEIMAVGTVTGETLWKNGDYDGIAAAVGYQKQHTNAFLTLGSKNVFLVDENDIVALDKKSGQEVWKHRMPLTDEIIGDIDYRYSNFCTLLYADGMVFFAQIHPGTQNLNKWEMKRIEILALDADSGARAWQFTGGSLAHVTPPDMMVIDGKVWTLDPGLGADGHGDARLLGLNARTGKIAEELSLPDITHPHHQWDETKHLPTHR